MSNGINQKRLAIVRALFITGTDCCIEPVDPELTSTEEAEMGWGSTDLR